MSNGVGAAIAAEGAMVETSYQLSKVQARWKQVDCLSAYYLIVRGYEQFTVDSVKCKCMEEGRKVGGSECLYGFQTGARAALRISARVSGVLA